MSAPTNDVLLERVNAALKAIDEHRQEARESSAEINARLGVLGAIEARVVAVEQRVSENEVRADNLEGTIHGTNDGPGLKGRQDRTERTVGVMVWAVAVGGVVLISKALEWISSLTGSKHP